MSSTTAEVTVSKLTYPHLKHPRLIKDGITWLRLFHARADRMEAPFYGLNIWQVKRKQFSKSLVNMLKLGGIGLDLGYGSIHTLQTFEVENDTLRAILIYDWHSLPKVIPGAPPIGILPAHFRFINSVEGYNWNLIKEIDRSPEEYVGMIGHRFHDDICEG